MPFGLANSPAFFQRTMDVVLTGLLGEICMVNMDDVVVWGRSEAEQTVNLQRVLQCFREWRLKLHPGKCAFGLEEIKLLGYIVDQDGLHPDPAKAAAIANLGTPSGVPEVRTFLGMSGYYRQCLPNYPHIAEPLVKLTRK